VQTGTTPKTFALNVSKPEIFGTRYHKLAKATVKIITLKKTSAKNVFLKTLIGMTKRKHVLL